jgi:ABC-type uncharacterized transport system involved in gliding motility auxiliary subunit
VVTSQLAQLNLASAGALELMDGSSLAFTPLIRTTVNSMLIDADKMVSPDPPQLIASFVSSGQEKVLAALVSGSVPTAFPGGPPAGVNLGEEHAHLESSAVPMGVIVVADTDMLQDRFWVNVQNFFGQRIPVPMADNGTFVLNSLDHLGGSPDLISIRNRATTYRPFELLEQISREAEASYRAKERELMASLEETEQKLAELQRFRDDPESPALTAEQESEIEKFRGEKVRIRKELRNVQFQLRQDIEWLEGLLKFVNIGLIPILLGLGLLGYKVWERRKRSVSSL